MRSELQRVQWYIQSQAASLTFIENFLVQLYASN